MNPRNDLQDLRFLQMAKGLEEMFEGLELAFSRHLAAGAVRDKLAPIFRDSPAHVQLQEAFKVLNARLAADQHRIQPSNLLESILSCERSAENFYAMTADRLTDPKLKALFIALAKEEAGHARCVEDALALQRSVEDPR